MQDRCGQLILATHSSEILNEASSGDIISVSSENKIGIRVASEESYRRLFAYIGSSENAEFARLARAKRILFFEGKDRSVLRRFAAEVHGLALISSTDTIFLQSGGFSQWRRIKEVNWTLGQIFGIDVKICSLFDRDYRCDEEVDAFISEMMEEGIKCAVLERKEIENYALSVSAISKTLIQKASDRGHEVDDLQVQSIIDEITSGLKYDVFGQRAAHLLRYMEEKKGRLISRQ